MTGGGFRAMKFTKSAMAALMMVIITGSGLAATKTDIVTLTINVTFTQPSCDIQVPSSYDLGGLPPGSKTHAPLDITWTCKGDTPVKTALTAGIVSGGKTGGDEKVILQTDGGTDTGATLSLREKVSKKLIKLTGPAVGDYFCSDVGVRRTCNLIPETNVSPGGPFGPASATLRFEVGYP